MATLANRRPAFWLFAILVNLSAVFTHRHLARPLLDSAFAFDIAVTVPAVYYFFLIRPRGQSLSTLFPIALFGLSRAVSLLPDLGTAKPWIAGAGELSICALVFWRVRKGRGENCADPVLRIQSAVASLVPGTIAARFIAGELSILYYALFAWGAKPDVPTGSTAFTLHKQTGVTDILGAFIAGTFVEIVPVHLIIAQKSTTLAWVVTALSFYGVVWITGLIRSYSLRPSLLSPDGMLVRYGIGFYLYVPVQQICLVDNGANATVIPRQVTPTFHFEFDPPLRAAGMLGTTTEVRRLGLAPDDQRQFHDQLRTILPELPDSIRSNASSN